MAVHGIRHDEQLFLSLHKVDFGARPPVSFAPAAENDENTCLADTEEKETTPEIPTCHLVDAEPEPMSGLFLSSPTYLEPTCIGIEAREQIKADEGDQDQGDVQCEWELGATG